ncbi:unnamed protein product [Rotaria sordida]|uniref:Secernin-2 n=1 Tax=Rotaria sordida TaxID=392033 RepID=A0A815M5C1_9BILA|nr:unnamed protein product [Rotaria sordida]
MVTISDGTESICIIFGKNCDCQSNEPLSIRYIPSAVHVSNSKVQTTYIAIDQIEKMNSCILFYPINIFGIEIEFNSHNLFIENEHHLLKLPLIFLD